MSSKKTRGNIKAMAVFVVMISLAVLFSPFVTDEGSEAAAGNTYTYTINASTGAISGGYTHIGPSSGSTGSYTSKNNTNSGSWTFDDKGYGPFNSFYAAFDPANDNKMVCHLDPDNLKMSVDGKTDITGKGYNIMWCLPTVYWKTDTSGNLVLTNDSSQGGTAYAHTVYDSSGKKTYAYVAYGVYEAGTATVNSKTILTSCTGADVQVSTSRPTLRGYANNQAVNTDGQGVNGYAMLWNFYQYELYKYCALAVMGGWDSQSIAGNGSVYGTSSSQYWDTPGLLDESGPYAGTRGSGTTNQQDSVKVFIENVWGSVYDYVDGIVFNGRAYCIDQKVTPNDSYSTGTGMTILNNVLPSNGWGSSPSTDAQIWGMPTANAGGSSSGLYDYVYSSTGQRLLRVGGYSSTYSGDALDYGLSCVYATNSLSDSIASIGGRLAFVFDADPASISTPTITYDHGALSNTGGDTTDLPTSATIVDGMTYPDLNNSGYAAVQAGYTHIGWYVDETFKAIGETVDKTGSFTAYSAWRAPSITITFYAEGKVYATLAVPKGTAGVVFTPVMTEGVFEGWYTDAAFTQKYVGNEVFNEDTPLYAKGVPPLVFTSVPTASATISNVAYSMYFFDATDSTGRYSVEWNFGDGNTSTDPIAYNTYTDPGHYTVTLKITNLYGDTDTKTYDLDVGDVAEQTDAPSKTPAIIGIFAVIVLSALVVRRFV